MTAKNPLRRTPGSSRATLGTLVAAVFLAFVASVVGMAVVGFFVYQGYADQLVPPEQALVTWGTGPSNVYDRNGTQLYQGIGPAGGVRYPVPLSQISPYLVAATIATEDASFYGNPGVNFNGIGRALMENLTPFGPGFFKGSGGSSITQQLVKNIYFDESTRLDRALDRKIKETIFALELKQQYSDDQIIEWYLNQIFYGNMAYGAEAAAQRYFGKSAKDLTLAEAAMLAGIPRSPANYVPTIAGNETASVERQHTVLELMKKHLLDIQAIVPLTVEQIDAAKTEKLAYQSSNIPIEAPQFVFYAQDQARKLCESGAFRPPAGTTCANVIANGHLQINTTLDLNLQKQAEEVVQNVLAANENAYGGHNGSVVVLSPKTGEILTMVGSRDYFNQDIKGEVNIAISPRSMGSTMKMFTYLTGFERGWTPSSTVDDSALKLATGPVKNWNDKYLGKITVRTAFSQSI
ncbi:MAG TPA: transglycosylase domain-containing protein, partial [Dehalococcoidia bacterium]|nr:transglycosylase domain-containing protein [Dehalococcoidia bacterium]